MSLINDLSNEIMLNLSSFCITLIVYLSLPVPCISESCIKIKTNLNFYFHTSLWCLKKFYEGFKSLKPFEAPQKSVKIKIKLIFSLRPGSRPEGLFSWKRVMSHYLTQDFQGYATSDYITTFHLLCNII